MLDPPQGEMSVPARSAEATTETTAAWIEPLIVTCEESDPSAVLEPFQNVIQWMFAQCATGLPLTKQQPSNS